MTSEAVVVLAGVVLKSEEPLSSEEDLKSEIKDDSERAMVPVFIDSCKFEIFYFIKVY